MNSSKLALKRARPALGSILLMRLEAPADTNESAIDDIVSRAFDLAEELEGKFSKFREASDVSRLNQASVGREIPVSREFIELVTLALNIWRVSGGVFAPFGELADSPFVLSEDRTAFYALKTQAAVLDLSGIAKGFVVDRVCAFLQGELPALSGVLNAGGDLRFFNTPQRHADIRLAHGTEARRLELDRDAIATSSLSESLHNVASSTVYTKVPRHDGSHVVSAIAPSCAVADALTKVGLFGDDKLSAACAQAFDARILIFDSHGALKEAFENPAGA